VTQTRTFTPREANSALPLVRRIVDDILSAGKALRAISLEIGAGAEENPEVKRLMGVLEELFDELEDLGCSYRDWNFTQGLVDFPSIIQGREVCLCWKNDEPTVAYYHEADAGFAGRKPVPSEFL